MQAWLHALTEAGRIAWRRARDGARLAVGVGDYEAYATHVRAHHPGQAPMDRETWFRNRVAARYGRGRSRCC
jgi:uncharacterized short protein YbdD (DUF466 family)